MIYIYLFILGTIFGSFYTVIGLRRPINESIIKPGSHCENCQHSLKWYELIPLFSYIIQKGKCRKCGKKISLIYPLVELLTGCLFSLSYFLYGFTFNTLISLFLVSLLVIIYVSDFKYFVILDGPLVIFGILILGAKFFLGGIDSVLTSILAGLLLMSVMFAIKFLGDKIFKRESLGGGDIKLAIIMGITVGLKLGLIALVFASFIALPYACYILLTNKGEEMPLGPFLITSLWLVFIFAEPITKIINLFLYLQ